MYHDSNIMKAVWNKNTICHSVKVFTVAFKLKFYNYPMEKIQQDFFA